MSVSIKSSIVLIQFRITMSSIFNKIDLLAISNSFHSDGYFIVRNVFSSEICQQLASLAEAQLEQLQIPVEFETDVKYPGAPTSKHTEGGKTVRRLKGAYARGDLFKQVSKAEIVKQILSELFKSNRLVLNQNHHNSIMTKCPRFSSVTLWHRDTRYWSFESEKLINVWLALGNENHENGCLRVLPGSHLLDISKGRFDDESFLKIEHPDNQRILKSAQEIELNAGDVLFFNSRLIHAAGQNHTDEIKYSLVYTYHDETNKPIENTSSSKLPEVKIS